MAKFFPVDSHVYRVVLFGIAFVNKIVDGDCGPDARTPDPHRDFVAEPVVQVNAQPAEVALHPTASPGRRKCTVQQFTGIHFPEMIAFHREGRSFFWVEKKIFVLREKTRKGLQQGSAVMTQPGSIVKSPLCIEANAHRAKIEVLYLCRDDTIQ
jgi:hypothetical protein